MTNIIFDNIAEDFINTAQNSSKNIFLTGNAGTGKTTLLKYFFENSNKKEVLILAPTGTAAINIGGSTIHRFFGLGKEFNISRIKELPEEKKEYIKLVDTIVIDEISMVRADLLDLIDQILRRTLFNDEPFGGKQMIFVGDPYQLPPVVTEKEKEFFEDMYPIPYFFGSHVWSETDVKYIGLTKVHRQAGQEFVNILNKIRVGDITDDDLIPLNKRVCSNVGLTDKPIFLTTTNKVADNINETEMNKINDQLWFFEADIEGNFEEEYYPTQKGLSLKNGAMIMFVKNGADLIWSNGSLGRVVAISSRIITVEMMESKEIIQVPKEVWEITAPYYDRGSRKIKHEKLGKFTQFPIKLAYAITVHKSQGKTFDKVYIDLSSGVFAFGQTYVALSRGRSLEGTYLKQPLKIKDIKVDPVIKDFMLKYF